MKVGWLTDQHDWAGGAELTMEEFRSAAPDGVKIHDCPPGGVQKGMDAYVVGNCVQYTMPDMAPMRGRPIVRYLNDVWPHGDTKVRDYLLQNAKLVFCSPLHRERFPHDCPGGEVIPPPVDLAPFRKHGGNKPAAKREGTCWVGMGFYGKGIEQALEWAAGRGERVDFYGGGPMMPPQSAQANVLGHVPHLELPSVLADYERFLFLPTRMEPFGRSVVEAWAAGCELVVNRNVGALHFIQENPEELKDSAKRFWGLVTG